MTNRQILNQAEEEASQATESTGETRARWVDGPGDGWMGRWTAGEMEGWKDRQIERWIAYSQRVGYHIYHIYFADAFVRKPHSQCIQQLRCTHKSAGIIQYIQSTYNSEYMQRNCCKCNNIEMKWMNFFYRQIVRQKDRTNLYIFTYSKPTRYRADTGRLGNVLNALC